MNNKNILFFIALFFISKLCAQDYSRSISLSIGSATPLGDFANTDVNNSSAGGAVGGACFDFEYKIRATKSLGLFGIVKTQSNSLDKDFVRLMASGLGANYTNWKLSGYMLGAYYNMESNNKFVHPKIAFGLLDATTPEMNFTSGGATVLTVKSATSLTFATLLGVDLGYDFNRFRLQFQYDFLLANPSFSQKYLDASGQILDTRTMDQSMKTYNVKIGLGYRFIKVE